MQLHDKLEETFRLDINQKKALKKLELFSVHDLLFYFPTRYSDMSKKKKIKDLEKLTKKPVYSLSLYDDKLVKEFGDALVQKLKNN